MQTKTISFLFSLFLVTSIPPTLYANDDENYIVSQTAVPRHFGDSENAKGEEVVNKGVDEGVSEGVPGQMFH